VRRVASLLVLAVAAASFLVALGVPPASAAKPCWQRLIDDWYDGRIDDVYSPKCYREAIRNSPEDIRSYSDLQEDLTRALQSSAGMGGGGTSYVRPGTAGRDEASRPPQTRRKGRSERGTERRDRGTDDDRDVAGGSIGSDEPKGPVPRVIRNLGPDDASSVPIPLIALGSLALLLVVAGAAGLAARRLQARRAPTAAASAEPAAPDS
jgi:hypothetical protein